MPAPAAITAPNVGDPTRRESFAQAVIDWITYFNSLVNNSTELIANGSFEFDSDNDGEPDAWEIDEFTGGTFLLDESTATADDKSAHGKRAAKFTSVGGGGNGGGTLTSAEFIQCSEGKSYLLSWQMKSSAVDVKNIVSVEFFDSTQTTISSTTVFSNDATNPTTWQTFGFLVEPPNNARYMKVSLIGCDSSDSTAGSTWFDDVRIHCFPPMTREAIITQVGDHIWAVPTGVGLFHVTVIGGGGGGGGAGTAGGGGQGGGTASGYYVATASSYSFTVGAGGPGGIGDNSGTSGGDSTFTYGATTLTGAGGERGLRGGAGGDGGSAAGGATGGQSNVGGQSGGDNVSGDGGTGGYTGLFGFLTPAVTTGDGRNGVHYGVGGGGAATSGNPNNGGNGADGAVIIRW